MTDSAAVLIGESLIAAGAEAAHTNTVLDHRSGPVGTAGATALAAALDAATRSLPDIAAVLAARAEPSNPYFRPT